MVIWLIGLSASGKTAIGKKLMEKLSTSNDKWIFLDGDTVRNLHNEDLGHTIADRKKNAYRISRICEFLSTQNVNVLACVLSIFHDNQQYNRDKIRNYKEVYIDVDFDQLIKRDNKELYKKALKGEIKDVVGVDIEFKPPLNPDLIVDNNNDNVDFEYITNNIIKVFEIEIEDEYSYTKNNLLQKPHKYQYSKFEGIFFYDKFLADRENTITFLEKRLERLKTNNYKEIQLSSKPYLKEGNIILQDYLLSLLEGNKEFLVKNINNIKVLLKRFEVSKKLHKSYDSKEIRKSSKEFKDFINYPLFSMVLMRCSEIDLSEENKLIYLNAILKCNDIISSIKEELIIPNEIIFSLRAIKEELIITRSYI